MKVARKRAAVMAKPSDEIRAKYGLSRNSVILKFEGINEAKLAILTKPIC